MTENGKKVQTCLGVECHEKVTEGHFCPKCKAKKRRIKGKTARMRGSRGPNGKGIGLI